MKNLLTISKQKKFQQLAHINYEQNNKWNGLCANIKWKGKQTERHRIWKENEVKVKGRSPERRMKKSHMWALMSISKETKGGVYKQYCVISIKLAERLIIPMTKKNDNYVIC